MGITWNDFWTMRDQQIQQGLSEWRRSESAKVQVQSLQSKTSRNDLYKCCSVTVNGPSSDVGGRQHMLDLALVIAPKRRENERVRVCIRHNDNDHLEFSHPVR